MPKTRTPFFSFGAFGSVARTLTARRRKRDTILEHKPVPKDAKTSTQLAWRTMYQACTDLWHTLTASEKAQWESDARRKHMTGYNYYMSLCLRPNPGIYLPLAGGTMSGAINMDSNAIAALPQPSADTHPLRRGVSGQDDLLLDSSGLFTLAAQSRARAYRATTNQVIPTASWTQIQFNAIDYDQHSEFDNTTNYRFTATAAGYYHNTILATLQNVGVDVLVSCRVHRNASWASTSFLHSSHPANLSILFDTVLHLDASDYLEWYMYHNAGANRNLLKNHYYTYVSVHKLS